MQLENDITLDDLVDFNIYVAEKNYKWKQTAIMNVLIFLAVIFIFVIWTKDFNLVAFLVGTFFALVWFLYWYKWGLKKFIRYRFNKILKKALADSSFIGSEQLNIDNTGIHAIKRTKTESGNTDYSWEAIKAIEENENYIYIFLDSLRAFIVPKRTFKTTQDVLVFKNELNKYWGNNEAKQKL